MRKTWLLPVLALVFSACNDGSTPNEQDKSENVARNYLSVNILTPKTSSRVTVNPDDYQDGEPSENKINTVRFFFFDASGNPSLVRKQAGATDPSNAYVSYIDWFPTSADEGGGDQSQTVEKILTATLGINMPATSKLPELVLAILNPTPEVLNLQGNPALSTLLNLTNDYYTGLTNGNFVITNSVYAGLNNSNLVNATEIEESNFQPTEDDASQNPLNIYVERVLARLDLSIFLTPAGTAENVFELEETSYPVGGVDTDIYVKLLGWNVTATTTSSRLIKTIDPQWPTSLFGNIEPWNIAELHRSFWAVNPEVVDYQYGTFNNSQAGGSENPNTANGLEIPEVSVPGGDNYYTTVYLQENANPYDANLTPEAPETPSKIILAAQLVDIDGNPQTLIRWANRYYTLTGALNAITNSLNLYQATTVGGVTQYDKITPGDLQFVTADQLYGGNLPEDVANYYVYVQLSSAAQNITWYNGNSQSSQAFTTQEANNYILNVVNYLMYWNEGYTYYYMDIRHLGDLGTPGYAGIVRNHLYKVNVTSIGGLGTPVYEPDSVIYPEMPGYDDSVLSAVINILQWRVVSQDYEFQWP